MDLEKELEATTDNIIVCGDVNIDANGANKDSRDYKNLIQTYDVHVVNDTQTRDESGKVIDHVATNIKYKRSITIHD